MRLFFAVTALLRGLREVLLQGSTSVRSFLAHTVPPIPSQVYSSMRYQTVLLTAVALWSVSGCSTGGGKQDTSQASSEPESLQYAVGLNIELDRMTKTGSGLLYLDRTVGTGDVALPGKRVSFAYVGSMPDGRIFDQSKPGSPYQLVVGKKEVIAGLDEGLQGMKVGGKRLLVIRPSLAYGNAAPGAGIPPNATLVFEVTLEGVQ